MSAAAELVLPMTDDGEVRIRTITDFHEFDSLESEWDALVEASGTTHPFIAHTWLRAWWSAFGAGKAMRIAIARKGGTLVGAAPLMLTEQRMFGLKTRVLESIANDHTPWYDFIVARGHEAVAYAALWQQIRDGVRWDVLQLRQLSSESQTLAYLRQIARRDALPVGTWASERSPFVSFDGSWDAYFQALGHNHKRNVGKALRRLQRMGDVRLEMVSSPEEVRGALAEGMRIEALAWKESAGTAMVSRDDVHAFYETFGREAAEAGLLRLFFLVCDGRRIAFSYGLLLRRTIFVLKGGYDPEFGRFSPYHVLYSLVFQYAFEHGIERYEFLGNDEPFKMKWTDAVREHCWLYVYSRSLRGRLLHYLKFTAVPRFRAWLR